MSEPARKLRVLVVDDMPMILNAFRWALGKSDYEVLTMATAEDAFVLLEGAQFDVIVSDTNLGCGMWGPELLDRARDRWPTMARVIMSGEDQGVAYAARENGLAHVFLLKPWRPEGPQEAIAAALKMVAVERRSA